MQNSPKSPTPITTHKIAVPQTPAELWHLVKFLWNIEIPYKRVCPNHSAPFTAFSDAFFAKNSMAIWKACIPAGTMVSTEEGPRAVEELTRGTRVWGLNKEENGLEIGTVKDVWQSGVDPIYAIKTKAGVFRCNGRHRLFVRRRFYTPQDGPGDHKKVTWKNIWLQADEITAKDYLLAPVSTPSEAIDTTGDGHESPPGNEYDLNGITFVPVSRITIEDPEPVYDLTVDGTATYIANGFISHNSRGFGGKCVRSDELWVTPEGDVISWGDMEGKAFQVMAPVEGGVVPTTALAEDNGPQKVWNITLRSGITISRTSEHPIYSALPKNGKAILPRLRLASVLNRGHVVLVPNKLEGVPSELDWKDENLIYLASLMGNPLYKGAVPDWILKCPEHQLKIFLNRLFTSNKNSILFGNPKLPDVRFMTISRDVANLLTRMMHRLGVPGVLRGFMSKELTRKRHLGMQDTFSWSPMTDFLPEFFEAVGTIQGKEEICRLIRKNAPPPSWKRTGAPEGYHWDSIMSVTTEEDIPTTTICVPEGNMFCGPVVEHNSFLLALLSLTEQVVLGASVNLLGGSGEQARRVLQYLSGDDPNSVGVLWDSPNAPKWMHPGDFTKTVSRTINGGLLKTLAASQTSIRGPHPSRLRLDECIAYDRRVATLEGDAPICYISKGVKVWCWDGSDFVPGTVKKAICKGRRKTLKIYLSTGKTLIVTGNHPMLTKNGWKHAEDCNTEDVLLGGPLDPVDVKILEISPGGIEEVWDLQVSPHHNFIAEGVVVHNCDELDIDLFDSAMGQTMASRGIKAQTVASSTHQHAFGTMSTLLQRARENSWLVHEWCVARGSLVLTGTGEIPIEKVTPGMLVATGVGWNPVQHCTYMGNKRVVTLELSSGRSLRVTADHKVATSVGWVKAGDLLPGFSLIGVSSIKGSLEGSIVAVRNVSWNETAEEVPVYDIGVEDRHEFVAEGVIVHNCYRENLKSNGGWLDYEEITRKRNEVTRKMWEIEYENQSPNPESFAIAPEAVDTLFDKSLGIFPGRMQDSVIIPTPPGATRHYHGADWAKAHDASVIHSMAEIPGGKDVLTHWAKMGRVSWPLMINRFNERVKKLGGPACHDATGLGSVVNDYLKVPAHGINLQSQVRADIFNEFIVAIERGDQMVFPYIESMVHDFRYASWEDIFGGKHPPDSFVAAALAWEAKRRGSKINIFRL